MQRLGLETEVVDREVRRRAAQHLGRQKIRLPTFAELADPARIPRGIEQSLSSVDPDAAHPLNLFRVHWHNAADRRGRAHTPQFLELPRSLTGVDARIVLLLGNRFPMIRAHKVQAAYACLAPRLVTGQFDPERQRAVWPSTGNYCRGGVAISRILGCRGVAVLPEGMSRERFEWLARWVADPADVVRTPGTESNVREIYDRCAELERDPANVILNQFCEFGNHLAHWACTGAALERVHDELRRQDPELEVRAYVSATGSAGTLGAGDRLKESRGARIAAVEALECPTLLRNGYGEHNIQGIGDKHVPLIHNVMNTDYVVAVSDRTTDELFLLFNSPAGREHLAARAGVSAATVESLADLGLSSICNLMASIRLARHMDLGPHDLVLSVATDGADLYASEIERLMPTLHPRGFDGMAAAEVGARHLAAGGNVELLELTDNDRQRIFNLGYFTWVEQQGLSVAEFDARRGQAFWRGLRACLPAWDEAIGEFNRDSGAPG